MSLTAQSDKSTDPGISRLEKLNVCVICPSTQLSYSEGFIRQHIELASTHCLHDGPLPCWYSNTTPLIRRRVTRRMGFLAARLLRLPPEHFSRRTLTRYLSRNRIDVVLAEYGPMGVEVRTSCRDAGIPLVVHFHGYDAHSVPVIEQYHLEYQRLFVDATAIIAVSRTMTERLRALGVPNEKLFLNPYGVNLSHFVGASPGLAKPTFLALARFADKKAPHLTLLSFAKVVAAFPGARLIMAGDGPLWDCCKQLAEALGITESVEFTGAVGRDRVATLMAGARAFVQHSVCTTYGDSEGTPVAVLEASATGLPVVSTRHAGIQEAVIHGETGFLVPEKDVNGMADYMMRLATDPKLAESMGGAGRRWMCRQYSVEKSIEGLMAILEGAVVQSRKQKI